MGSFVFLLGLILGSFANVVVMRLNTGESLIYGGSRCFSCSRRLRWFELIPVVSYFAFRGKCRSCGAGISLQYPLVELASGLLFLFIYLKSTQSPPTGGFEWITFALTISFFWLLLTLSVYDIRHQILPDMLVGAAAAAAIVFVTAQSIQNPSLILVHGFAGAALFLFFGALWFFSQGRWMGLGDAKLAFAVGLFLGPVPALVALFLSFWTGAAVGIAWVLLNRIRTLKIPIPFGPFLAAGAFVAYLWGDILIEQYLRLVIY
ncbi:MAG: prepilin peptidase [Candidatus Niyogibacteria bacterium]|nr:prepilin peptidase [Candidatus Niyogibacteria bacterium]